MTTNNKIILEHVYDDLGKVIKTIETDFQYGIKTTQEITHDAQGRVLRVEKTMEDLEKKAIDFLPDHVNELMVQRMAQKLAAEKSLLQRVVAKLMFWK